MRVALLLSCLVVPGGNTSRAAAQPFAPDPVPQDLVAFSQTALQQYPLLAIGEVHNSRLQYALLTDLIRAPRIRALIDDVVVEFGNAFYQDRLDGFLLDLEDVPAAKLAQVWRDHSESPTGPFESPIYRDFVYSVRAVNEGLARSERIRIVAADPPVNWDVIRTSADFRALPARSQYMGERVVSEVLQKNRRAILIVGGAHLSRRAVSPISGRSMVNVTSVVEQARPGSVYVLSGVAGFGPRDAEVLPRMADIPLGSVIPLRGHFLGDLPGPSVVGPASPTAARRPTAPASSVTRKDLFDAYLWVGTPEMVPLVTASPQQWADDARWAELNRRSVIRFGVPLDPETRKSGQLRPAADQADHDELAAMSLQERLDRELTLQTRYREAQGDPGQGLARVARVVERRRGRPGHPVRSRLDDAEVWMISREADPVAAALADRSGGYVQE